MELAPTPPNPSPGRLAKPSPEIWRSPHASCTQTELCRIPADVTSERPSGETAIPSSSVGPKVNCSGTPPGKCWRQIWYPSPASALKYIILPSGLHAAYVQRAVFGPAVSPPLLPSKGSTRHGRHPTLSISETRVHLPSGDIQERCAIPPISAGRYTSRSPARLSVAVAMPICMPVLISENTTCSRSTHVSAAAFGRSSCGSPPSAGTTQVFHPALESVAVYAMRDPSGEKAGALFGESSWVS